MTKELWINLPVKNAQQSKAFFTQLGFSFSAQHGSDDSACLLVGSKNAVVMLFEEPIFKNFTRHELADAKQATEVLISIDAESREEVDEMARKAVAAGGTLFAQPAEIQGWMYGCGFADLDGHRWNVLYMDLSQMPRG
ncbi:MAG: extradiol dioxygenase [Bacteroidetes bacterium]|nr:extradiol dioxygenase [Bacteroidota bacterium]